MAADDNQHDVDEFQEPSKTSVDFEQDTSATQQKGPDEMFCSSCGSVIKKEAEICPECGVRQNDAPSGGAKQKSKATAGLLALFLGGLGAHKFYLGKWKMGFLYVLFCWTFIPAIVALVEAIQYFRASDAEFQEKYVPDEV